MKKLLLSLFAILCLSANVYSHHFSFAENESIQIKLQGATKKLSRSLIEPVARCYYLDGKVHVDFNEYVENVNVSVINTDTGEQFQVYSSGFNASIYLDVPSCSGEYYVEIEFGSTTLYGYYNL